MSCYDLGFLAPISKAKLFKLTVLLWVAVAMVVISRVSTTQYGSFLIVGTGSLGQDSSARRTDTLAPSASANGSSSADKWNASMHEHQQEQERGSYEEQLKASLVQIPDNRSTHMSITDTSTEASAIVLDQSVNRKTMFVHVGKAGGNTVRSAFPRLSCLRQRTTVDKQDCFRKQVRNDSPFANSCDAELHLAGGTLKNDVKNFTTFLYAIRNPVERAISSYQYLHHNNTKSTYAQSKHPLKESFYKDCFPTLQDMLSALNESAAQRHGVAEVPSLTTVSLENQSETDDDDNQDMMSFLDEGVPEDTDQRTRYCQWMAIASLQGTDPRIRKINVHLHYNYQHYHDLTGRAFPDNEILAVRTETVWDDIVSLDLALGGSGVFRAKGAVANENVLTKPNASTNKRPTAEQLRNLCCVLWEENETYQEILNRATNLDYRSKLQSMREVWDSCSIDDDSVNRYGSRTEKEEGDNDQEVSFSWSQWNKEICPHFVVATTRRS